MLEVAATWSRNISPWVGTSFPTHLQEDKANCFIFLAFSLLEHRSLLIVFMVAFCSAITTSIFPFCSVSFLLFLLVVFVFSLVSLLLIILRHSFLSLDFCLLVFLPVVFSSFLRSMCFFFLLFVLSSSCIFSFSCVSFCDSPLVCSYVSFCPLFSFRISFECSCFVFFVSLFLLFLILCVFFSPGPRVRLKRTTMEKTAISFCLPFGDLCENVLCAKLLFNFSFVDFFCPPNMFLYDILGICFEGVRDPLLLLICCYIVVWVFGEEPSLCPTCLLCQYFWDSFCFVLVLVGVFLIFGCFCFFRACWGLFFCFAYLPHLGLSVSSLLCGRAGFLTSCLGCLFLRVGFGAFILWLTLLGRRSGRANREGSIYFSFFS